MEKKNFKFDVVKVQKEKERQEKEDIKMLAAFSPEYAEEVKGRRYRLDDLQSKIEDFKAITF